MSDLKPVSISSKAAEEIKIIMQSDEIPNNYSLRVGVSEGGCGSGKFTIGFDELKDDDITYEKHGVQIYISKKHVMYLIGMEVDYRETNDEWGFVFNES